LTTPRNRVLVVGTTTDYIDIIRREHPDRAIFLTDPAERARGKEEAPDRAGEILVALDDQSAVLKQVFRHARAHFITLTAVACFDCESMLLASQLAHALSLPYPSEDCILACRSKFLSKQLWRNAGLDCPDAVHVRDEKDIGQFLGRHGGEAIIIKPLTGSGSELVFLCSTVKECSDALEIMRRRLAVLPLTERMHARYMHGSDRIDPRRVFLAEEYIEAAEYSCDFVIDGDAVQIIRLARKYLKPEDAPGTVMAYGIPADLPTGLKYGDLEATLLKAAQSLGIRRALCMLDFLLQGERIILLELAPRPGGDCLPQLIRKSCGCDMLGLTLDVAEGSPVAPPKPQQWQALMGLRLFAPSPGIIASLDITALLDDPRVLEVTLMHGPGHRVVFPPGDYSSRILGHAIISPSSTTSPVHECLELMDKLVVTYGIEGRI
jgi:biotin carboxylase